MLNLPHSIESLADALQARILEEASIHTATLTNSGSKITLEQYLLLHVVWPKPKVLDELNSTAELSKWLDNRHLQSAKSYLASFSDWERYIEEIRQGVRRAGLGAFTAVRRHQLNVAKITGINTDSAPKVDFTPVVIKNAKSWPPLVRGQQQLPVTPTPVRHQRRQLTGPARRAGS